MEDESQIATERQEAKHPAPHDLFLSYATDDQEFAKELHVELQRNGLRCFMAEKDVRPSDQWEVAIRDALLASKRVLLLLTPRSLNRPWVLLETGAAWALKKDLIPALVHVSPTDLVDPIRRYQARVIETPTQIERLVSDLVRG